MKTTQFLSIALASVVLLAGCAKEDETTNLPENGQKIYTLEAATPDDSRTALDGVKVYWAEGDALGVVEYRASGENMTTPITYNIATGAGSQIATFTSPIGIATDKFLAVYPASGYRSGTFLMLPLPATQTYVENGIANNTLPMYAFSEDPKHLSFKYAASVLRVPVYADAAGEKVARVTVSISKIDRGNDSYPLAGTLYFATANWGKFYGFSSGVTTTSIVYNMNDTELSTDPENPTVLNIVVGANGPTKTYNILQGLTFFFESTDGRSFTKTKGSDLQVNLGTVVNFPKLKCAFNQISDIVVKVDGGEETIWSDYIESPTVATNSIVVTTQNDASLTDNMLSVLKQQVDACANAVVLDMRGAKYGSVTFPATFKESTKLAEIYLPYNITNLAKQALYKCSNLTDAHLHEGLLTINDNAFGYTAINPLYIPASVNKIGYFILNGTGSGAAGGNKAYDVAADNQTYKSIAGTLYTKDGKTMIDYPENNGDVEFVMPDGVEKLAQYAMMGSTTLKKITLPASLTTIAASVWQNVKYLETIDCKALTGTIPTLGGLTYAAAGSDSAKGMYPGAKSTNTKIIYVPEGRAEDFKAAWSEFVTAGWEFSDGSLPSEVSGSLPDIETTTYNEESFWE